MTAAEATDDGPSFVDTNVFLRFLTNDVPEQAAAAETLFRQAAAGRSELITNTMVVAEIVWVLESFYGLSREEVRERALGVVHMDGLLVPEIDVVTDALLTYEASGADFLDAYNTFWMKEHDVHSMATFDKQHYGRLEGLTVYAPG